MLDKNSQVIRRGCFVRYEGKIYKVRFVFFKTIKLNDGEKDLVLYVPKGGYPVLNLEVIHGVESKAS